MSKLTSSWLPARVKWGWELRLLRHFGWIVRCRGCRARVPRRHFLCAGCGLESHLLGIGRLILSEIDYIALGRPRGPPWQPKGSQSGPRAAQRDPKGPQSRPKEEKRRLKDTQRRTTNHKTIYTYTKYMQTPDPSPYSGQLHNINNDLGSLSKLPSS